ncbi:MAG: hypothetical protein CL609_25095 [Anaerolineaceae bacterium]|nr:hypothetical protein [Anaerolineaceae bacterium]
MPKVLFLPGYACTSQIWQSIRENIDSICSATYIDWPTHITPNFHQADDFANWLNSSIDPEQYDFIIGHSMGGVVTLRLTEIVEKFKPTIILMESFLTSPSPFFQNLILNQAASAPSLAIPEMLAQNKIHYSSKLGESLRKLDLSQTVIHQKKKMVAFYGDRGSGSPERVQKELQWPDALFSCVDVTVVPNACHFPMVENPAATMNGLKNILESEFK